MDIEPIYCAEQIVVPPDLADVLKAYTKEVIRRQPTDLLEFSAIYFANLANVANSVQNLRPPTLQQLKDVIAHIKHEKMVATPQIIYACQAAGLAKPTINKALEVGNFANEPVVNSYNFLLLLLSMKCDNFSQLIKEIIDIFGTQDRIPVSVLVLLFEFLVTLDPDLTKQMQEDLTRSLQELDDVTYDDLTINPVLKDKLSA